jgi:hypothetical protein
MTNQEERNLNKAIIEKMAKEVGASPIQIINMIDRNQEMKQFYLNLKNKCIEKMKTA